MNRYFDFPSSGMTMKIDVVAGSPAALASKDVLLKAIGCGTPEDGREVKRLEYAQLTRKYQKEVAHVQGMHDPEKRRGN